MRGHSNWRWLRLALGSAVIEKVHVLCYALMVLIVLAAGLEFVRSKDRGRHGYLSPRRSRISAVRGACEHYMRESGRILGSARISRVLYRPHGQWHCSALQQWRQCWCALALGHEGRFGWPAR